MQYEQQYNIYKQAQPLRTPPKQLWPRVSDKFSVVINKSAISISRVSKCTSIQEHKETYSSSNRKNQTSKSSFLSALFAQSVPCFARRGPCCLPSLAAALPSQAELLRRRVPVPAGCSSPRMGLRRRPGHPLVLAPSRPSMSS